MTQEERRIYLIQELQKEMPEYDGYPIPKDEQRQRYWLKGLFNLRPVQPAPEEFTKIQDEYLQERARMPPNCLLFLRIRVSFFGKATLLP